MRTTEHTTEYQILIVRLRAAEQALADNRAAGKSTGYNYRRIHGILSEIKAAS